MSEYTTFLRSCKNWREFAQSEKVIQESGLTYEEARQACQDYNANLTEAEEAEGTKMEFTASENL